MRKTEGTIIGLIIGSGLTGIMLACAAIAWAQVGVR